MSEDRAPYALSEEEAVLLARLRKVLTPGQLLHLTELLSELIGRRFGRIEIRIRGDRVFMDKTVSDDCGKVVD